MELCDDGGAITDCATDSLDGTRADIADRKYTRKRSTRATHADNNVRCRARSLTKSAESLGESVHESSAAAATIERCHMCAGQPVMQLMNLKAVIAPTTARR